jgi:protein gp37
MADKSKIEWLDGGSTWNPAYGCSKVSAGCENCFAHRMISMRFPHLTGCKTKLDIYGEELEIESTVGWDNRAHFKPERLEIPFHWKKPRRIFVCSMSDLFHESLTDEQIAAVFGVMAATPQHQYVVLTKRLHRAVEWFEWVSQCGRMVPFYVGEKIPDGASGEAAYCVMSNTTDPDLKPIEPIAFFTGVKQPWPLENVIMCASVENQPTVNERVSLLLQIPARWRGVSVEPMLSRIDLDCFNPSDDSDDTFMSAFRYNNDEDGLDLVICGAETGPGKRPFKDEWALDLRDQCKAASVPFFFKKDGSGKQTLCGVEYHEWPED